MPEILSQSEIDALLSALSTGTVEEGPALPEPGKGIKLYDFKHPDRFSKDQTRSLNMIHEHFSRLFSTSLSTYLRTITEVKMVSVDQLSYDEFIRSIPNPTCINLFEMRPLEGNVLLEISPSLSFAIIDRLMGGKGQIFHKNRELTEIEKSILQKIIDRMFESLHEAWEGILNLSLHLKATEVNPQLFLQLYLPTEMVILMTHEAHVGECTGTFCICIPYVVLEPIAQRLSSRSWFSGKQTAGEEQTQAAMKVHLRKFDLGVTAILGGTRLKVKDLLSLEKGDVVPLTRRRDEDIEVQVSGKPMFLARPGTHRKHRAVKVTKVVSAEMEWLG
jgi:flagellar motor switch protein FliM